jgi:hypothetical protein
MRRFDRVGWNFIAGCGTVLATLGTAALAHAQEAATPQPVPCELDLPERVVDGHVLLSPAFMPTPFLGTHFRFVQGVTQMSISDFPIAQGTTLDVDLVGLNERIQAGVRFADRFEVFGFGTGEVLSGISGRSVLAVGSSFAYSAGLGGRIRLFRSSESGTEITAYAEGSAGSGGLLDLLRLADALVENSNRSIRDLANENLGRLVLGDTSSVQAGGRLLAAQSLGKNFDLQGSLGADYVALDVELYDPQTNREFDQDFDSVNPEASIAFGANIMPLVPIGFLLEYSVQSHGRAILSSAEEDWTSPSHLIGLGIHTVHPNFQIGLTFARLMNLEPLSRIDPLTGETLTSERPVVHYVQFGMDVVW